jgi:hypothetical protein
MEFKSLRDYIQIVESAQETNETSPRMVWDGVKWTQSTVAQLAEWAPSPEQAKWLGGANQQDPYILNRMPGTKPPITYFTDPADQAKARQMGFPEKEAAAPAPAPAPAPAVATPVTPQTNVQATPLAPAAGQGATPAAPAAPAAKDPKVLALQQKLNALGAGLTADGVMGPKTQAAMTKYGLDASGTSTAPNVAAPGQPPATLAKDTNINQAQTQAAATAIKNGQKNPTSLSGQTTIAQPTGAIAPSNVNSGSGVGKDFKIDPAQAAAVAGNASARDQAWLAQQSGGAPQAFAGPGTVRAPKAKTAAQTTPPAAPAAPAAPAPDTAKIQAEIDRFSKGNNMSLQANKDYVAKLQAQLSGGAPVKESTGYDEVERIISLVHYR